MEFPNIGEHCSEPTCNRLDFLPMKCDACESIFCTDHILYNQHSCPSAYKKDVQVPVCPLCNTPIPTKRGDPPDLAVGRHIDNDCQSDFGKKKQKVFVNKCSFKGCKIKEIVQVTCSECSDNYCLKHRHPTDHSCIGKEEALRLKRQKALAKVSSAAPKPATTNQNNPSQRIKSIQGSMSEDEALARALQASMQEEARSGQNSSQPVLRATGRNRCWLS